MNKRLRKKLFAAVLAFIITFANFTSIGNFMVESIAANINLETQSTKVDKANIEFDAYFVNEGEIKHSKEIGMDSDAKIYLKIKVTDGYLANGTIKMNNSNFRVKELKTSSGYIQSIDSETNTVVLNQIDKGESVVLEIPISINTDSNFALENVSKITDVVLNGLYINNKAEEKKITKTINVNAKLTSDAKSSLEEEVTKYTQYDVNGEKRLALELTVKSSVENNVLPIKETNLEIEIPKINNKDPKEIAVSAKSLNATNGEDTKIFSSDEYNYEDGKITLTIKNEELNGIISWKKDVKDEIIVACVYSQNEELDYTNIETKASNKIYLYDSNNTNVSRNIRKSKTYSEKISDAITYDISANVTEIQKGYMLVSKAEDTKYIENISVNIADKELADSIILDSKTDYLDEKNETFEANQKYLSTKISKDNFISMFGEDGYINIYDNEGKKITTLNNDNLSYTYETETTYIKVETSKPITAGIINIQNERGIKPLEYSKEQEETFIKMKTVLNGTVLLNNKKILIGQDNAEITLNNPTEQVALELNRNALSTVVLNENVTISATLKTTDASTVLYKNPSIEIILPKYITEISMKKVSLVYDDQLVISNTKVSNKDGKLVITTKLIGEQTEFNKEKVTEGATIVIEADITANELTPSLSEDIIMNVKNEATDNTITEKAVVNFIAPVGLATINQISNFNDENNTITSLSGKSEIGELQIETAAKTANVKITIINNYNFECEKIAILGRTPFKGNEYGSTFTAKMVSKIKADENLNKKYTIYYSKNGEATKDLSEEQNGWTEDPNNIGDVKSYLIVLNNEKLATGETVCFNYDVEIPENLEFDESAFEAYTVFYKRVDGNKISGTVKAAVAGISTGEGPDLNVVLTSSIENKAEIEEGQIVKYTAKITNKKNRKQDGVSLTVQTTNNVSYKAQTGNVIQNGNIQEITIPVGQLKANETKNVEFELEIGNFIKTNITNITGQTSYYDDKGNKVEKPDSGFDTELTLKDFDNDEIEYNKYLEALEEYKAYIEDKNEKQKYDINTNKTIVKAIANVDGFEKQFTSNEIVNTIIEKDSEPKIQLNVNTSYDTTLRAEDVMEYGLTIRKNVSESLSNVVVTCNIPEGLTFFETTNGGAYDEKTRTVTWKFDVMDATKFITLRCKVENLPKGVYEKEIPLVFSAKCNENERKFTSSTFKIKVIGDGFTVTQTSNISDGNVAIGDEVVYSITIKNVSTVSSAVTVTDYLPEGFEFINYEYKQNGGVTTRNSNTGNAVNIPIVLDPNETLTIYLTAKVTNEATKNNNLQNKIVLNSAEIKDYNASTATLKLQNNKTSSENTNNNNKDKNNTAKDSNKEQNVTKITYRVTGVVWVDANKNGQRDGNEELIKDVETLLIDSKTNTVVAGAKTDESGVYTFDDVEKKQYIVAFNYDELEYDVTTYQAEGVNASVNCDAINMYLNIDGKINKYAATNTVFVSSNTYNLDLGLVINKKFDLELKKSVAFMQTSNAKGTQNYLFNKSEIAKIEIPEKEIEGTVIAITYNFTIENTGAVPGYANKIVDYIPADLSFSSSLNPEWYQDTDGNVYNVSLANRLINPGEKVELTLVLTKTMTDENIGVVNNSAEICETSNDYGVADLDSSPANRATIEDDFSTADIIVTIKTGGAVAYTTIAVIVFAIFGIGTYFIKKKVLPRV